MQDQQRQQNNCKSQIDPKTNSKIPIYAKISAKINSKVNSSIEQRNGLKDILLKPKSKLYKASLIEKKKPIPVLKSKPDTTPVIQAITTTNHVINANSSKDVAIKQTTSSNNITASTNGSSHSVLEASASKKQMQFEKNAIIIANNIDQQEDDLLYKKVYLNNNNNNNGCAKYRSQLPVFNNGSENDSTKSIQNLVTYPSPSKLTSNNTTPAIDTSINSLKESINNFKKKFSNTIKLDSNNNSKLQNNESLTKSNHSNEYEIAEEEEEVNADEIQDDLNLAASTHSPNDFYVDCISSKEKEAMSPQEPTNETKGSSNDSASKTVHNFNCNHNESDSEITAVNIENGQLPLTKMSTNPSNCNLIVRLNESVSLNSFKSEMYDSDQTIKPKTIKNNNRTNNSKCINNELTFQPAVLLGQGELIEECKNSLNELIKASKWATNSSNNTTTSTVPTVTNNILQSEASIILSKSNKVTSLSQSPPVVQTRIKYLEKSKIGSFPASSNSSPTSSNRFNNYDNLIQIKIECAAAHTKSQGFFHSKLAAPLASTSELDENLSPNQPNSENLNNSKTEANSNTGLKQQQQQPSKQLISTSRSSFVIQQDQNKAHNQETNNNSSRVTPKPLVNSRSTSANNLKYFSNATTSTTPGFSVISNKNNRFFVRSAETSSSANKDSSEQSLNKEDSKSQTPKSLNENIDLHSALASSSSSNISNKSLIVETSVQCKAKSTQSNSQNKDYSSEIIAKTKEETSKEKKTKKNLDFNDYDNDSNSFNNKCKRFSTTSEILIKKSSNQETNAVHTAPLNGPENSLLNTKKLRSRRSTPGLNCSESLSSFQNITTTNTTADTSYSSDLKMTSNPFTLSRNKSLVRLASNDQENKYTETTHCQEKSATLKGNKKQTNSSAASTTSSMSSSSSSSSWLAQSFRKAFGKAENNNVKKKFNKNKQTNPKMMSSLSINNYATVLNNTHQNNANDYTEIRHEVRNSCTNSKRSSLSDDEDQIENKPSRSIINTNNSATKLSLLPSNFNDTDSEYDDEIDKPTAKHKNTSLISKRSYRSESELVTKFQQQQQIQQYRQQIQIQQNDAYENGNCDTINSKKLSTLNELNNAINVGRSNNSSKTTSKLTKTHKSVNSLLMTPNANEANQNQFYKLQEINQTFCNQPQQMQRGLNSQFGNQCSPPIITKAMSMQKFSKCNCKLNDSIVTDLKKKLNVAENKLTDIRLEALSSVHQVDQLKDYLDKMKNEMIALRSENQILKKYIKDIKLQKLNLSFQSNEHEMNICQIDQMFESFNNNLNNYYYSYNFLLGDENESLLRKALITVECSYELKSNRFDYSDVGGTNENSISINSSFRNDFFAYEICTINIDSKLKWQLMDGIVSYVFKRYLNKLDSNQLGLGKNSIEKYHIGEIVRKINDTKLPDLLPFGYLVGDNCTIRIILKDNYQDLDSLCYETLLPKYLLEDYVHILENHRLVAITNFHKFGKTYLMRKLAQFMSKNSNKEIEIIYYDINDIVNEKERSIMSHLTPHSNILTRIESDLIVDLETKLADINEKSAMILLDNFHHLFVNDNNNNEFYSKLSIRIINSILKLIEKNKLYLVLTTQETNLNMTNNWIEFNRYFKWINLSKNYSEFLSMFLNRNLIHYQVEQSKNKESCVIMEKVVSYVCEIFKISNELIFKLDYSEHALNPLNFLNLPFGIDISEKWFIELWNYTLVPFLNDLIKMKLLAYEKDSYLKQNDHEISKSLDTAYISDWVVSNYVWNKSTNKTSNTICTVNQRLFRLKSVNEILSGSIRVSTSSDDLEIQTTINNNDSNCSNKHLISMLNRLQKAAQNNTQKDDASSGCFDSSNSSNTPSPKSNSPTNIPTCILNFKENDILMSDHHFMNTSKNLRPILMSKLSSKSSKIESAL